MTPRPAPPVGSAESQAERARGAHCHAGRVLRQRRPRGSGGGNRGWGRQVARERHAERRGLEKQKRLTADHSSVKSYWGKHRWERTTVDDEERAITQESSCPGQQTPGQAGPGSRGGHSRRPCEPALRKPRPLRAARTPSAQLTTNRNCRQGSDHPSVEAVQFLKPTVTCHKP